jgi:hypothetical protein
MDIKHKHKVSKWNIYLGLLFYCSFIILLINNNNNTEILQFNINSYQKFNLNLLRCKIE